MPLFCIITNCKNLISNATTDKCFFFKVSLPKDAGWTPVFVWSDQRAALEILWQHHTWQCTRPEWGMWLRRDPPNVENASKRQKLPNRRLLKRAKNLWKERDVTLAPRNVECDDIRIFSARWPTKVLPQFPLWSVLKDFLSKLKFQTWLIFSRWKADVIYTTSSVPMLRLLILSILFGQFSGLLVGRPIWFGIVWYGVVWFGMVW